ncbi:homeobox-leucine zipper protein PROTODERMAL FACTOR 2-like isoform X2 [Malania oleifera]|uniref:homeobox-leucine zipper protein PROTODERMAL FACTOR 2-like isoform X2 n=1 Tax=Malania oleifera TaxID=397392 RepID=UPI0025ADBDAF|nr:homeobox-leucine zipper protein PROTODERMAL FACTOR 2-like isoform X2 [Malania oleifera]
MERNLGAGPSNINNSLDPGTSPDQEIQDTPEASMAIDFIDSTEIAASFFLELQAAKNICNAAYKELLTKAVEANTWILSTPAIGNFDEIFKIFRAPAPSGMRVECSIEKTVIPILVEDLLSIMMDVRKWASSFCHIVYRGSSHAPSGILRKLSRNDPRIQNIQMVNAEFQLPTTFMQSRKLCFLRFQREIIPKIWAIFDVSEDYFNDELPKCALEQNCLRRPSGVIIREHESGSEIIWIENMLASMNPTKNNIYSNIICSNLAFCAKNWVSTLLWKLKRSRSLFREIKTNIQPNTKVHTALLELTQSMKMAFLSYVNEALYGSTWVVTLPNIVVRLLRAVTVDALGLENYVGLTSFRVLAKPLKVFEFLVRKNFDFLGVNKANKVVEFSTYDNSNCITIDEEEIFQNEFIKLHAYVLRETSRDEFCSFVISSPVRKRY